MSGNSSERRRTTSPMRSILVPLLTVVLTSALHEGEPVLADLELVAVLELLVVDPAPVDERPVQRALVLDEEVPVALDEHGVVARDGDVVEEDLALRRPPDACALAARAEALPRPAAAGPDDERRALEPFDGIARELADILRGKGLRRFHAGFTLLEQGAAARAVVCGLRVLEAALRAVNVTQALAPDSCDEHRARTPARSLQPNRTRSVWDNYDSGDDFPARISVRRSTSTSSRMLRPPERWSRATSSAPRMSISPARARGRG